LTAGDGPNAITSSSRAGEHRRWPEGQAAAAQNQVTVARVTAYDVPMRCAAPIRFLVLVALLPSLQGEMKTYLKMEIDPGSRVVRLFDEHPISGGVPTVEYFEQFLQQFRGQIRSSVDRVIPGKGHQLASRAEAFYIDPDGTLTSRRRFQEVFSIAGTSLVAESSYQYLGPVYAVPSISFAVRVDGASIRSEQPKIVDELPDSAKPLNGLTVIRISKLRGVDVAAIATYTEGGELFNVAVDPLKSGVYLPQPAKPQTMDDVIQESIYEFGFPVKLAVDAFQRKPTPVYQRSDTPAPLTVVSFHYARNHWVQQYIFDPSGTGTGPSSRLLEFPYTAEDESLRFFDQALAWRPANDQRTFFPKK
jgi:hypothetical protein